MNKFTQGKWIANGYVVESEDGKTIAGCGFSDKGVDEEEKANAQAISMIPDMVASLESHLIALGDLYPFEIEEVLPEHYDEFRAVHALINKTELLLKQVRGES